MKIVIFVSTLSILMSCSSSKFQLTENAVVTSEINGYEYRDGKSYFLVELTNNSDDDIYLNKTFLEYPSHTITDKNGRTPSVIRSIQIVSNDSSLLRIQPNKTRELKIEAKFLDYYSLIPGSSYDIKLEYSEPKFNRRRSPSNRVSYFQIGDVNFNYAQ
ncbi:MAG: hypothetical protein EOM59_17195 [Clostridia bacterium]|nr:hypothetical protein [Clostridia bacterium]